MGGPGSSDAAAVSVGQGRLFERDEATARLQAATTSAALGRGAVVIIEGPAGIGKTSLLALGREIAADAGGDVRIARTGPLESDLGWNVVRQLFADVLSADDRSRDELLAGTNALAAPALGLTGGSDEGALHGLYWLTAELASRRAPVVLAVDDAQWADSASLRFLAYLALRVEDLPVLITLAVRSGEPLDEALTAITLQPSAISIRLRELSPESTALVGRARLGADAATELCDACHTATHGNPFLLGELVAQLKREGIDASDPSSATAVDGVRPESVTRGVLLRIARLPEDAMRVAEAVAILGQSASAGRVAALAGIDQARADRAIEALAASDILSASPLEFVHPIVRQVVIAELDPLRAARAHANAARILSDRGAGPELVAAHLLRAEPAGDSAVVAQLREAARTVLVTGAAEAACSYLRRAVLEPPEPALRGEVMYELGVAEARADLGGTERIRAALQLTDAPRARAEIALVLGHTLGLAGHHVEAADVLEAGLAEPHEDTRLRRLLEGELAGQSLHAAAKLDVAQRLVTQVRFDRPIGDPGEHRLRVIAMHALLGHLPADQARALARGTAAAYQTSFDADLATLLFVAELLIYVDELDDGIAILDAQIAEGRARGSLPAVALASAFRAQAGARRGTLREAEADGRLALNVLDSDRLGYSRAYVVSFLIDVLVELEQLDEAEALLPRAGPRDEWPQIWQYALLTRSAARLRLAQARVPEGVELMRECAARAAPWDVRNPSVLPWRGDLAVALASAGERPEAADLAMAEVADARTIAVPRALGMALRAGGIAVGGAEGVGLLREAVAVLEGSVSRLEHARALVDLGAALRRAGNRSEARAQLHAGLDSAQRCGARSLATRARNELKIAGGHARKEQNGGSSLLTPSELRVAQLAAEGRMNREIAQALFVSLRTVETHLTHVYQKLDLSSRDGLPAALEQLLA